MAGLSFAASLYFVIFLTSAGCPGFRNNQFYGRGVEKNERDKEKKHEICSYECVWCVCTFLKYNRNTQARPGIVNPMKSVPHLKKVIWKVDLLSRGDQYYTVIYNIH